MKDSYFLMSFLEEDTQEPIGNLEAPALHVTFLAHMTFKEAPENVDELINRIRNICVQTPAFTLPYGEKTQFGVHKDKTVLLCEDPTGEANEFHETLKRETVPLMNFGQPEYTSENFKPHITLHENAPLPETLASIRTMTLVCHENGYGSGKIRTIETFSLKEYLHR